MSLALSILNIEAGQKGQCGSILVRIRPIKIGRDPFSDWVLLDPERQISGHHCTISFKEGRYWIEDTSTNGTFLNGNKHPIASQHEIADGDVIYIGHLIVEARLDFSARPKESFSIQNEIGDYFGDKPLSPVAPSALPAPAPISGPLGSPEPPVAPAAPQQQRDFANSPKVSIGRALFRVPRTMLIETAEIAELRLSSEHQFTVEMREALEKTMVGRGKTTDEHTVKPLGCRMKATLFSDSRFLVIEPISSEVQDMTEAAASWDWRILPVKEGASMLTLRISMIKDTDGNEASVDSQALHTTIDITVRSFLSRPRRFVRDNWKWLLGSSGIGLAAAISSTFFGG